MKAWLDNLLLFQEMEEERAELKDIGLTNEEIDSYFDFYIPAFVGRFA